MSTHDDFDINITQTEDSELSEKEYSDILGLEGMAGGGETALEEETEEEKEEDSLVYVVAEQHIIVRMLTMMCFLFNHFTNSLKKNII